MWKTLNAMILVIGLISSIGFADALCPPQTWNTTDSLTLPPENATAGDSCVFNISRPGGVNGTTFTTLTLSNIVMAMDNNDSLVIYDGEKVKGNILMSITKETVVSKLAIAFNSSVIIEYNMTTNDTGPSGNIAFDLEECTHKLADSWQIPVSSPLYKPGRGDFSCVYTVSNSLPANRVAVVSFSEFSLLNESYVAFTSGKNTDNSSLVQRDFFTDPSANETTLEFVVTNNTIAQSFSVVFDYDIASCTEDLTITSETVMSPQLPARPGPNYRCHLRVNSENNTLILRVEAALNTGLDSLIVLDGPTSESSLATRISESVSDYLFLSSGSTLTLQMSLHATQAARSLNMTFIPVTGDSHRLCGNGTLSLTGTPGNKSLTSDPVTSDSVTSYWQLNAEEGSVVQLSLRSNLTGNATLTCYDGLQMDENKIAAVLTAKRTDFKVVVGGATMLVVLTDFSAEDNFTASFDSVSKNCDQTLTSPSGLLQYVEVAGAVADHCTWTLAPQSGPGILVLTPQLLSLGPGDNVTVYSGLHGDCVLATFTTDLDCAPLPQLNIPAADGARIVIHDSDTGELDMKISVNYRVEEHVCGGDLTTAGMLTTPNFPNQYPVNSNCEWKARDAMQLFLSLDTVNLASGHNLSVFSQGVKMVSYGSNTTVLPPDFITATNHTELKFSATPGSEVAVSQGAKVKYWLLDCGGMVNMTEGNLTSPHQQTNESALCVWIIQMPGGRGPQIIDFNITVNGTQHQADVDTCLKIYDGTSLRSTQLLHAGNVSSRTGHLSRYDTMIVVYNHTVQHNSSFLGFNLTFRSKKCDAMCSNGVVCMHSDWKCNGVNDCGDFSDEKNCTAPPPTPAPPAPQNFSGWVKSGWIPACLFIGMGLGAALIIIIPRIIRRARGGGNSYARMGDHTPVVA